MSEKNFTKHNEAGASEFELRLASLRKDVIASEERVIRMGCAMTNETYLVKFKRQAEGQPFTVSGVAKDAPPKAKRWGFDAAPAKTDAVPLKSFNWSEFDLRDFGCPGCGEYGGRTACCGCGRQMCRANTRRIDGERTKFFCHPACGANFYAEPATNVTGDATSRPALPSPENRKALEAPRLRLPGRRE